MITVRASSLAVAAPPLAGGPEQYTVRRGDTLSGIAQAHGISLAALARANSEIASHRFIFPGDKLVIPRGTASVHVVARGEALGEVARAHGTTVADIAAANRIGDVDRIHPGQRLVLTSTTGPVPEPARGDTHLHFEVRLGSEKPRAAGGRTADPVEYLGPVPK